jgi:hypothetical protein
LNCSFTQVANVSPLRDMTTLVTLDLRATKVPAAEIVALQQALPNCQFFWDGAAKPAAATGNTTK